MRTRAIIHVAGPPQSGKTSFVEAMLSSLDERILAARCVRDDSLRQPRESVPKAHPELRRYCRAGASGAALFRFPGDGSAFDGFFSSELMTDYSEAVVLEGDDPLRLADLKVFVAPVPAPGERLFVRCSETRSYRERAELLERFLAEPANVVELLSIAGGDPLAELGRQNLALLEDVRAKLVAEVRQTGRLSVPKHKEGWAIADRYAGIEDAQLVVVNVRAEDDRAAAEELAADVKRVREDKALFADIIGHRGTRVPVTVVVTDVTAPADVDFKKALARIRRAIRSATA
ncbi:MAG: hypothetical protein ACYDGN_01830 [Acidimicrobiales bacterium]